VSTAKSNSSSSQKVGTKAMWRDNVITDMVDIICSSEYLRTNLIFRNTSCARNAAIYTDVVKQRRDFPFDMTQTSNKCVAECKKAALTTKMATGIKWFQEEKNFSEWKSIRASCQQGSLTRSRSPYGESSPQAIKQPCLLSRK